MEGSHVAMPLINKSLAHKYRGKDCVLVGRIENVSGSSMTVETSDKQKVSVDCGFGTFSSMQGVVELVVSVGFDGRFVAQSAYSYGDDFDLTVYNDALNVLQRHLSPFGVQ
ncbi:uncharacterized protein [Oscarella lobularis]|uniref:uncharacterized protein n=1 Tax=Oscarella lobularis TaxID=121494 RepID=UPI003314056F